MKAFKTKTICKFGNVDNLSTEIKFKRNGNPYNVVYSADSDKWFLNTTNNSGVYVTLGEIN